jgi:hypothetical protein
MVGFTPVKKTKGEKSLRPTAELYNYTVSVLVRSVVGVLVVFLNCVHLGRGCADTSVRELSFFFCAICLRLRHRFFSVRLLFTPTTCVSQLSQMRVVVEMRLVR